MSKTNVLEIFRVASGCGKVFCDWQMELCVDHKPTEGDANDKSSRWRGSIFDSVANKNLYIIAGCNGAGKTTASYTILPEILNCKEFVNADEIAKGLSPFQHEKAAFEAGRIMLNRIDELLREGVDFAFETTLSTRSYHQKIAAAKMLGYDVSLLFFWLRSVDLAKDRVNTRVLEGGHNIPEDVIERRYTRGINNLFEIYIPLVGDVFIFDNSDGSPELIAEKKHPNDLRILDVERMRFLKETK